MKRNTKRCWNCGKKFEPKQKCWIESPFDEFLFCKSKCGKEYYEWLHGKKETSNEDLDKQ